MIYNIKHTMHRCVSRKMLHPGTYICLLIAAAIPIIVGVTAYVYSLFCPDATSAYIGLILSSYSVLYLLFIMHVITTIKRIRAAPPIMVDVHDTESCETLHATFHEKIENANL